MSTAVEMKLQRDIEYSRMQAAELEERENQIRQIKAMFDEREQRHEDTYNLSSDYKTKAGAYYRLEELRDLRKEFDAILRTEG